MTKLLYVFLGLIVLASATSELGIKKSQELRAKVLASPDGIAALTPTEYKYFVQEQPRPYDVVVFFTAGSCTLCSDIEKELSTVASFYREGGAIYPYKDGDVRKRAVYHTKLMFDESSRQIFMDLGFKSVPNLLVSPPKMAKLRESEKGDFYKNYLWQISASDGTLTSQKLLDHVNKKVDRNITYKESVFNILIVLTVFGSIFGAGVLLFLKFRPFFLNHKLWFIGSMVIYVICMSGIVYNIIHNVPLTNVDRNGNLEWYHSGSRSQFGLEGYIMSSLISFVGLLLIGLMRLPKIAGEFGSSNVVYIAMFLAAFLGFKFIEGIYKAKSGFYNPQFYPPAHYQHGPLRNDQGNTI